VSQYKKKNLHIDLEQKNLLSKTYCEYHYDHNKPNLQSIGSNLNNERTC